MDATAIARAAESLRDARQSRRPLEALDAASQPQTIAEGHAVQDALIALLGEPVAGWKVAGLEPDEVMRGAVLASRLFSSPAEIDAASMPLLGIEAEIAFRFLHALPPRAEAYTADEVAAAVVALPAIEVVDTRFASYTDTPLLHRLGDFMSNGGLVCGEPRPDWRSFDFRTIPVTLQIGAETIRKTGGHSAGDPLLPAVAFANAVRGTTGIAAGEVVTTGTFTGLVFAKPGDRVSAEFEGFGRAELTFRT